MKFFDPKEEVLDIELTQYGRFLLSLGKWKPEYYAFFDANVLYDAEYGGVAESKNSAETRIQDETPSLKTQATFIGRENELFNGLITESDPITGGASDYEVHPDRVNIEIYEKLVFFTDALGTTSLDSTKTPAYNIQFLQGEINGIENNITGSLPTTTTAHILSNSQHLTKIPQIDTDIEFKITTYDPSNPKIGFESDPELSPQMVYDDGLSLAIGPEQILLMVEEKNSSFDYRNFDIEVFEITDDTGYLGEEVMKQLSFVKPLEMVKDNLLIEEREAEITAGRLNGQTPDLDPTYVEYYFNVYVDDEIDENVICNSISELKAKDILIDTDINCPDLLQPITRNIYYSDAEDDECLDN